MVLTLVLIHVWLIFWVWFCVKTIWRQMAQRTYEARMTSRLRSFLMPGSLNDRSAWVRQQKVLAWVGLVLGLAVYVGMMARTLR